MLLNIFLAGLGGFLGAVSRFAAVSFLSLPIFGILAVNIIGSFFAGVFLGLPVDFAGSGVKIFFITGFLGAFTTFSAFSAETFVFLKSGAYGAAVLNILISLFLCIGGTFLGFLCSSTAVK